MDAAASVKQEAQPACDDETSSVSEARRPPSSELALSGGSGGADDQSGEDEQVERFYALLANIRALRNVYGAGGPSRKRARVAEPPWRPKFRMEDFRDLDNDAASVKKDRRDDCLERQRPENDDDEVDREGEVVEENDRVSASQSTRASTDSA